MGWKFHDRDALLDRLTRPAASRDHVFLFGAALTAPQNSESFGVPGVSGVVELIREHYRAAFDESALADLDRSIASNPAQAYQIAFEHLQGRGNSDDANRIIRHAVSHARLEQPSWQSTGIHPPELLLELERDITGWHLSPAVAEIGTLLATQPPCFAPLVLTTNFDPLIEVSVERAGGHAYSSALDTDGRLDQVHGRGCHVVHLHGYWLHSDTLHTTVQLGQDRPQLQTSLERVLANRAVVVIGYGGWDDVFTRALSAMLDNPQRNLEILWAFHGSDTAALSHTAEPLLRRLLAGYQRGRVTLFKGVDLHWLLPALNRRLSGLGTRSGGSGQVSSARNSSSGERRVLPLGEDSDASVPPIAPTASPTRTPRISAPLPSERQVPPRRIVKYIIPALVGAAALYYVGSAGFVSCSSKPQGAGVKEEPDIGPRSLASADETIRQYWQFLNESNFESAWNLLSSSFQGSVHAGSYADYERTHRDMAVCSVSVQQTQLISEVPGQVMIRAPLVVRSGSTCKVRLQNYLFTLVRDAASHPWLIDKVSTR